MSALSLHELSPFVRLCGEFQLPPGFRRDPYFIYEHEFIYVISGEACYQIGKTVHRLAVGDLLLVPPAVLTASRNDSRLPLRFLAVHFDFHFHGNYQNLPPRSSRRTALELSRVHKPPPTTPRLLLPRKVNVADEPGVKLLLERIIGEVANKPPGHELAAKACLLELLVFLQRRNFRKQPALKQSHQAVELATRFLESHYSRPLRLKDIATAARLSPIYLERLFKRATGRSPMAYLSRLRVGRAKHLLGRTDMTVKEVAGAVGFEAASYFTRVFQKLEGVSPMRYRRMTRGLEGVELAVSLTRSPKTGGGPHFTIPTRRS
jgi:AraC-like DNA-binding protein